VVNKRAIGALVCGILVTVVAAGASGSWVSGAAVGAVIAVVVYVPGQSVLSRLIHGKRRARDDGKIPAATT
jgi:cytosine/uracil/thiamine/allantoin permease